MRTDERRVVITGLGIVTPLGIGAEAFWDALATGRSAVDKIKAFPVDGLPNDLAAEVPDFNPKALANPNHKKALAKNIKVMARDIQLAVAGAELAMADAGLASGGFDPARIGIDLGAGLISSDLDELAPAITLSHKATGTFDFKTWGRDGINEIDPLWMLKYLPNMLACHISILNDCQGPSNSITEAEAASNIALGEAARIIARNRADLMVSGGADSKVNPLGMVRMTLLNQMTSWSGEPARAVRPFDRSRDGWVAGEGAAIVILEELGHARGRGARIYGEVLGFGSGCDANPQGGLDPHGRGLELAMRAALRDAGLEPSQIGHINAHGAAGALADLAEARAIHRVFGPGPSVPVTALTGFFGNLASGAGAVKLAASLLGVNRGLIPPTINCDDPDPECDLDLVRDTPRPTTNPIFLSTNVTRHGQAAALVVRGNPDGTL